MGGIKPVLKIKRCEQNQAVEINAIEGGVKKALEELTGCPGQVSDVGLTGWAGRRCLLCSTWARQGSDDGRGK